jgi:glycerate kinase
MNILIAPDSFKDCLTASEVATALKKGILEVIGDATIQTAPVADGGEGTVEAVIHATGGTRLTVKVRDPLMRQIESFYGITGDGLTAVIEMAAASGIELLQKGERDPWITSTYGTGQLILDALDKGCQRIMIGIGGSATNDGGAGMAKALGIRFLNRNSREIEEGGGALGALHSIDLKGLDPRIMQTEILVACDVTNPLTGPEGASVIYGPQKGADPGMVARLDENLAHYARIVNNQMDRDISAIPGSGAAGGLGAGLMAFLDAKLVSGFELVADTVLLEEKIAVADLVITGEGKMDHQTQFGKTPYGVAQMARKHGKPVIGVAGSLEEGAEVLYRHGFDLLLPIQEKPEELSLALKLAGEQLVRTGERIGRMLVLPR